MWKLLSGLSLFAAACCAQAEAIPGQGTWGATLLPRDVDHNGVTDAYYDTALNVTWLRDATLFDEASIGEARAWAAALVVGEVSGWRLPKVDVIGAGCYDLPGPLIFLQGCASLVNSQPQFSEVGHLYSVTMGNVRGGALNTGDFRGLATPNFAFALQDGLIEPDGSLGWNWIFIFQSIGGHWADECECSAYSSLVLHDGDVLAVPEPVPALLWAAGLALLAIQRYGLKILSANGH